MTLHTYNSSVYNYYFGQFFIRKIPQCSPYLKHTLYVLFGSPGQSSISWAYIIMHTICVSSLVTYLTHQTRWRHHLHSLLLQAYMLMSLYTSLRIQQSKQISSNSSQNWFQLLHGHSWMVSWHTFSVVKYCKEIQVHLSQTGIAAHLVKENNVHMHNITPDVTNPCCSGLPINAIPESDED